MIIKAQGGAQLCNWDDVGIIHLTSDGKRVQLERRSGSGCQIASYRWNSWAIRALDMLFIAVRDGETAFEFPSEAEMETTMVHRSHVKTKATRHGGS